VARLRLANISKTYRRANAPVFALREITLEVSEGELLTIVGPSGCGKTTLLRIIAGLARPDAGTIWFDERDVSTVPPERRRVGFVFQHPGLYPHLSVYENIAFGPRVRRLAPASIEGRVRDSARRMRVDENLLPHSPREISGGQQQRVALARALATEPGILLLDEPLSALDAQLRLELRVELARIHDATGATTLFVTHDQADALSLGRRIAVMRDGRLEQIGTPRELYDEPANTFVARFVGAPPMALFEGQVADGRFVGAGGLWFIADGVEAGPAIAGFRAGDVRIDAEGEVRGVVRAVEDLGAESYAYVDGDYGTLVVRTERPPRAGESVALRLDAKRAKLFDVQGKRR
jgi:multiple sugar transport system ATP-binding protein